MFIVARTDYPSPLRRKLILLAAAGACWACILAATTLARAKLRAPLGAPAHTGQSAPSAR